MLGGCAGPSAESTGGSTATPAAPGQPVASRAPTRAQIAEIQQLLVERGYNPGPVDGLLGPRTTAAIDQYQGDRGLARTGRASPELLSHLRNQPKAAPAVVSVEAARGAGGYEVGERYVFSNGLTHDIVEIRAGQIKWRTSDGETYLAQLGVGLPVLSWEYGSWRGRNRAARDAEAAWPPVRGTTVDFDVSSEEWNTEANGTAARQERDIRWSCRNEGSREVEVAAGRFAVDVVTCERWPVAAGDWQTRIWYYAPTLDHYVRRDDLDTSGLQIESLTLVAALPGGGKTVQTGLRNVLRDTLSNRARNEPAVWTDPGGGGRFVVRVTRDFRAEDGRACRNYTIVRAGAADVRREFPGVSCYDKGKKQWRVPGL
ncbi:MAG: peptidoglycan-binding protein [Rhodospirillales bacterium]|nr:MAG: peptidoglycan-binding protein [Rhodospirillales bacterium]